MEINEEEILKDIIDHVESINELSDLKIALLMFISSEVLLDNDPEFQNLLNKYNKDLVNNENIDEDINNLIKYVKEDTTRCLHSNYPFDTFIYDIFRIFLKDRELAQKVFNKTHDNV